MLKQSLEATNPYTLTFRSCESIGTSRGLIVCVHANCGSNKKKVIKKTCKMSWQRNDFDQIKSYQYNGAALGLNWVIPKSHRI